MSMKLVNEPDLAGRRVLLRVDFNVPIAEGKVTDDTRIRAVLPTIRYLLDNRARVIIISHQGRPRGIGYEVEYSLEPIAWELSDSDLLGQHVSVVGRMELLGDQTKEAISRMADGDVIMLENLRFDPREKGNDPEFARNLAELADLYVDDAFACAHRAHASIVGVTDHLPSYAGFLLGREIDTLDRLLSRPQKPFVAILGGSKVSDKIGVIDNLIGRVDVILIGGAMCFTFLLAQGYSVGTSLCEKDWISRAAAMIKKAKKKGTRLLLPSDIVMAADALDCAAPTICRANALSEGMMGLDIGPGTSARYAAEIITANTVLWNGPMGVFEAPLFAHGTRQVATAMSNNQKATTIVGGGDTIAALNSFGLIDRMSFISTGGGAMVKFLEGKDLPGVVALSKTK